MYFSARAEGRISYGHLGRTNSCSNCSWQTFNSVVCWTLKRILFQCLDSGHCRLGDRKGARPVKIIASAISKSSLEDRRGPGLTWSDLGKNRLVQQKSRAVVVNVKTISSRYCRVRCVPRHCLSVCLSVCLPFVHCLKGSYLFISCFLYY